MFTDTKRSQHIDEVGKLYEQIKDNLTDLLSDLTPASYCQKPINPRITKIYDQIGELRNLACARQTD